MKIKKILLPIILLAGILFVNQTFAQVARFAVYGYVVNQNTGNPLPDQMIIIQGDTTEPGVFLSDTVYSDGYGYFIDSITSNSSPTNSYKVFSFDCQNNALTYTFKGSSPENPYIFDFCASPNFNCHAEFTYSVNLQQPLTVHFDNHSFGSDFFKWEFGDGDSSCYGDPVHTYSNPGIYNVKLTVWDNWPFYNCTDYIIHTITLSYPEVDAHFTYAQNQYNPLEITFQNQSNNNAHYYNWDFGDGTFSTLKNPYKKYDVPGNYNVKLTVFDALPQYNSIDSTSKQISQDINLYFNIGGQIFNGLFPVNYGYSELYRQEGQLLVFEESTEVNSEGAYSFYKKFLGNYLVRAHDIITGANPEFMPSYIGNSIFWQEAEAKLIISNDFTEDITLRQVIPTPTGTGLIRGVVRKNCPGGITQAASDITVFLLDAAKNPYNVHYSDENGSFSFSGLAFGTYVIYPEITGKWSSPVTVVLDSMHPQIENLYFLVELSSVAAVGDIYSPLDSQIRMSFYPNPCYETAVVSILSAKKQEGFIKISDLTGRTLISQDISMNPGTNSFSLALSMIKPGSYIIGIEAGNLKSVKKFTKLND